MLNSKIRYAIVLAFMTFSLTNCTDDSNVQTTVDEDKANIEGLFNEVITEAESLKGGCAVQGFDNFYNFTQGVAQNSNWVHDLYTKLKSHLNITTYQTGRFAFSNHFGTHSWDANTQSWNTNGSPNDKIVLQMPEQMGAVNNTIVATATSYSDQMVNFNQYQYWLPTALKASATVNGSPCIAAELVSASYDNTSFQIPVDMELNLTLEPYEFKIKAKRISAAKVNVELRAFNNGTEKFSLNTDLTYKNANYETLNYFNDCIMATGDFTFGDFKMPFSADFETARSLFNPSNTQVNALFDADVFYKGNEIADLDYRQDSKGYTDLYIVYKDETSEDLETYYKDFKDRLELVMVEFTGPWPN